MEPNLFSEERLHELTAARDELMSELIYIDYLMRSIGFTDGLATVKHTAQQMCRKESPLDNSQDPLLHNEDEM